MKIRVLHIFSLNYKKRFGGPIFDWKYAFSKWDDPVVTHLVLDYDKKILVDAKVAFNFEISTSQVMSTRIQRICWIFSLLFLLNKYKDHYDILHFHVLQWGGLIANAWAKVSKIPTIYQSVLQNSDTPSNIINQKQGKLKFWLLRKYSGIIAISHSLAEDYIQYGFSKDQVFTLMNSVDTQVFFPVLNSDGKKKLRQKFGFPQDAFILLFTGSIIHRKGVDLLISSFLDLANRYSNLFLVLVGPKAINENPSLDMKFINNLKTLLIDHSAYHRVKFFGLIDKRTKLAEFYRMSDIFVFPSRNEGLGNVVLEAMACGLPVIISDIPPLRKVVIDGVSGKVVPVDDQQKLSNAIFELINQFDKAMLLGNAAREYVVKNHSFSEWQSRLVQIYHQLIERSLFPNR